METTVYVAEINEKTWESIKSLGVAGVSADIRDFESKDIDVIVDFAGYGTTAAAAIDAVRPGGRVVQVGMAKEMATISAQKLTMKEITYVGSANGEKHECEAVLEMMATGRIRSDVIPITFEQIPEALEALAKGGVQGRYVAVIGKETA